MTKMNKNIYNSILTLLLSLYIASSLLAVEAEDFVYDSKSRRDPFIPLITHKARGAAGLEGVQTIEDVNLEGIVWDARGDSIAILNGVIIKEGQTIANVTMKRIEEKSISLLINQIEHNIQLIEKGE